MEEKLKDEHHNTSDGAVSAGDRKVTVELLNAENKWLMYELNHRVRNILQVVLSLLNVQTYYLKDQAALKAVQESQRRMFAISLIHKKLYIGANTGRIPMRTYVSELVEQLTDSFGVRNRIVFTQHVDGITLDGAQAVSLGLIINEAVCNAIEYAFPDHRSGIVEIGLYKEGADSARLVVSDNGVGIRDLCAGEQFGQLGFNLIRGLSHDLDGTLTISSEKGTTLNLWFQGCASGR